MNKFRVYLLVISVMLVAFGSYISLVDGMAHLASVGGQGIIGAIANGLTFTGIGLFIFALGVVRSPYD